jgi:hypothetical protein
VTRRTYRAGYLFALVAVAIVVAAVVFVRSALSTPSVPGGAVDSVVGGSVNELTRYSETNPTDEWTHTYVLLDVTNGGAALEVVVKNLEDANWSVRRQGDDRFYAIRDDAIVFMSPYDPSGPMSAGVRRTFAAYEGAARGTLIVADFAPNS